MKKNTKENINPTTDSKEEKAVPQYANVIKDKMDILRQYQIEKDYAIRVRQVKIQNWLKNEELYNGVTQKTLLTRSNLHIPVVFEGVQNASSKIECTRKTCRDHKEHYIYRKRTLNSYYAITTAAWMAIMDRYRLNKFVSSCGKIEGELGKTGCRYCGNCLREYFATVERMKND